MPPSVLRGVLPLVPDNVVSGGPAGASSLLFVYSLDYARPRPANDAKFAKGGGERQFNGLVDVYLKMLKSNGIAGLNRGFVPSVVSIIVYRGPYFDVCDSLSKHSWISFAFLASSPILQSPSSPSVLLRVPSLSPSVSGGALPLVPAWLLTRKTLSVVAW